MNSRLLSGELATYIAGRYVAIEVWPLSFDECLAFRDAYSDRDVGLVDDEFRRFLRIGGFPSVHVAQLDEPDARTMMSDIYRSALVRDVLSRYAIRDTDMFERVAALAIDNVGNPFLARRGMLENIVWLELRRRGYDVSVGRVGSAEVDFVARRHDDVLRAGGGDDRRVAGDSAA